MAVPADSDFHLDEVGGIGLHDGPVPPDHLLVGDLVPLQELAFWPARSSATRALTLAVPSSREPFTAATWSLFVL